MKNKFNIDEQYLTDVRYEEYRSFTVVETGERLENVRMVGNKDHPEFEKLRTFLAENGFIHRVTTYWNGDTVLKPFELNGFKFYRGDGFPCAIAMRAAFSVAKKHGIKRIGR